MKEIINDRLNEVIISLLNNKNNKKFVFVLKGFNRDNFDSLNISLLSNSLNFDLEKLFQNKNAFLKEIITKLMGDDKNIFLTYEEILILDISSLSAFADLIIIKNNIYNNKFPLIYNFSNKDYYIKYFNDEEVGDNEIDSQSLFFKFYGDIIKTDDNYYISYIENFDFEEVDLFNVDYYRSDIEIKEISVYDDSIIEITDNDEDFLRLIENIQSDKIKTDTISISSYSNIEVFKEKYEKTISILQLIYSDKYNFKLVYTRSDKKIIDETEYLKILEKYWGYKKFKLLKNYESVNYELSRNIIEISQSQIIDDIVNQSENAYNEKKYRDIFVTASTGSGKSAMFQIPAIYLAEKYNLMTIVISPLIGLMFDQVKGLEKNEVTFSATINSNVTPIEKESIYEKIKANEISILYISPETLLSRSDIEMLIGNRKLGLVVIDEAHIVTTWGKAFRSDYWYLGTYLNKLRKDRNFPIATFTATAIYGGYEDMYRETKESLVMISPISYFGYVKRDNIDIMMKKLIVDTKFKEYRLMKFKILSERLKFFYANNQKTLVYFPTISLIRDFYSFVENNSQKEIFENITYYYGSLDKNKKQESYHNFLNGNNKFMLATKAFGMGIDISDIHNIYHFAPTGNVCDYVQEIGRVARGLEKGKAYFDFMKQDFVHVKRLHGLSTIRKNQLIQIIKKVLELAELKNNKQRNFVIDPESFAHIFKKNMRDIDIDADEIGNKLKIGLMLIEKDFYNKLSYSPIVARPQSIFSYEFFKFEESKKKDIILKYNKYLKKIGDFNGEEIFAFNIKQIWDEKFTKFTFPQFKYFLFTRNDDLEFPYMDSLVSLLKVEIFLKKDFNDIRLKFNGILDNIEEIFNKYYIKKTFFNFNDIISNVSNKILTGNFIKQEFINVMMITAGNYDNYEKQKSNFYQKFLKYDENKDKYKITNHNYSEFILWCRKNFNNIFKDIAISGQRVEIFYPKYKKRLLTAIFHILGLMEAMDLATYIITGGDVPQIFIRINSFYQLQKMVSNAENYTNSILSNVYFRHKLSVNMLTYMFTKEMNTEDFWDTIEDYFLGKLPEEVEKIIE